MFTTCTFSAIEFGTVTDIRCDVCGQRATHEVQDHYEVEPQGGYMRFRGMGIVRRRCDKHATASIGYLRDGRVEILSATPACRD